MKSYCFYFHHSSFLRSTKAISQLLYSLIFKNAISGFYDDGYAITPHIIITYHVACQKMQEFLKVLILTSTFIWMARSNSILRSILVVDIGHGFIGSIYGRTSCRCRDDSWIINMTCQMDLAMLDSGLKIVIVWWMLTFNGDTHWPSLWFGERPVLKTMNLHCGIGIRGMREPHAFRALVYQVGLHCRSRVETYLWV